MVFDLKAQELRDSRQRLRVPKVRPATFREANWSDATALGGRPLLGCHGGTWKPVGEIRRKLDERKF
jgi:hypothetical protein